MRDVLVLSTLRRRSQPAPLSGRPTQDSSTACCRIATDRERCGHQRRARETVCRPILPRPRFQRLDVLACLPIGLQPPQHGRTADAGSAPFGELPLLSSISRGRGHRFKSCLSSGISAPSQRADPTPTAITAAPISHRDPPLGPMPQRLSASVACNPRHAPLQVGAPSAHRAS